QAAPVRGTLVHAVLERLFDSPSGTRSLDRALELLPVEWARMVDEEPAVAELVEDGDVEGWLAPARDRLATYFSLENPDRLEPAGRELAIEAQLPDGPLLRGLVDRLDAAPDGALRVVDYKT